MLGSRWGILCVHQRSCTYAIQHWTGVGGTALGGGAVPKQILDGGNQENSEKIFKNPKPICICPPYMRAGTGTRMHNTISEKRPSRFFQHTLGIGSAGIHTFNSQSGTGGPFNLADIVYWKWATPLNGIPEQTFRIA
jgi:hypothetical protein